MAAAQYFEQVQKIFIAFYQRPADPAGLKYWAERVDVAGGNINQVIDAFASSAEATTLYGAVNATTIGDVIDKLYMALFNVAPDAAGKAFYVNGFAAGTFTAGTIALAVLNGAQNADLTAVNNKVAVANLFTAQVDGRALTDSSFGAAPFSVTYNAADEAAARGILKAVTSVASTVLTPTQVTDALKTQIANAGDAINGSALTTAITDTLNGTSGNDLFVGVTSATPSKQTYDATDAIIDASTTDHDSFTLTTDGNNAASASIRNIETINVNIDATTTATAGVYSFAAANVTGAQAYNFDVTKAISAVTALTVTGIADNVAVNATDKFSVIHLTTAPTKNLTVDAKALGTTGTPTKVTVTAGKDVTVTGAGDLAVVASTATGMVNATAQKGLSIDAVGASVVIGSAKAGNLTVLNADAAAVIDVNATGSIAINDTGAGSIKAVAGSTITVAGTVISTSANLSSVGASAVDAGGTITSMTLAGNGGAATYTVTTGTNVTDVTFAGTNNVTLKAAAADIAGGTSTALNVYKTMTAGTATVELSGTGAVNMIAGNKVDVLKVTGDNAGQFTVVNGQEITYTVDQTLPLVAVGALANAANNAVTIKLDDGVRDVAAVDLAGITITQAKTVTIDASIDTTGAGTANASSIGGITASAANSNITINTGVNGMTLTGTNTLGTGKLTVTGSGAVALGAATLTASEFDASAVTGVVSGTTLNPTNVRTISTGSANDTLTLANTAAADATIHMGAGNDTLTLAGQTSANKATVIDLGDGTDTLKFVASTALVKGTGSVSLAGVETIEFANGTGQQIQAELLTGKTYVVNSATAVNTNSVAVVVAATDTAVDLSTLAGSTAVDTTLAAMTFATNASANTAATNITGLLNAKNSMTGSSAADVLTGGNKADIFNYSADTLLFTTGATGVVIDTVVGGTGTDAINFTATAATVTVLNTSSWANVSGVEKITSGPNTTAISLSLDVTAQTQGITTVDLSGDTDAGGVNVVDASEYTAASGITVTGSAGTDRLTGGAGNDTFFADTTALLLADTIVGGLGVDVLSFGVTATPVAVTIANTVSFANISGVETLKAVANSSVSNTIALDVTAYSAGVRTVDMSLISGATGNTIDVSEFTSTDAITLIGSATGSTVITGGSGNDIMSGGSADDTFVGGSGSDVISLSAGGMDTVTVGSGNDTITGFTAGVTGTIGKDTLSGTVASVNLVDAVAIATNAIVVTTAKATEFNYIFGGTALGTDITGGALLAALKGINVIAGVATDVALTSVAGDTGFLVAYQAGNAYVYSYANDAVLGTTTAIEAGEITLIATLTGVVAGSLVGDNFA